MLTHIRQSLVMALITLVLFGFVYAFVGTGVAQLFFRSQADGSLTADGSTLIGQNWNGYKTTTIVDTKWFHGRPDADNPLTANGKAGESAASNQGPSSTTLKQLVHGLVAAWHQVGVEPTADLVTSSGSGLDPDITQADALVQIPMVAKATGIASSRLRSLIISQTHRPTLGFLGSTWIDVLSLNQALSRLT